MAQPSKQEPGRRFAPNPTGKGGWKPGQSGNPSGMPKEVGEFRVMCREYTPDAVRALAAALHGADRVPAAKALLAYAWGAPTQEITGPNGGPIRAALSVLESTGEMTTDEMRRRLVALEALSEEQAATPGDADAPPESA